VQPGDPAALVQSGFGPTAAPGSLTRRQIVDRYAAATGRDVGDVRFYYTYAIWKLAVVLQQIYARFVRGNSADERFAGFAQMVALLGDTAADVIERPDPLEPRG
jgi:aminoglycoside phosphotransferase (APT) family kinase protein